MSRSTELRGGWLLIVSALAGTMIPGIPQYATGVLMPAWAAEFGWSRAAIAIALSVFNLTLVCSLPLVGRLAAHVGVRRIALWSMAMMIPAYAHLALLGSNLLHLYVGYAIVAITSVGSTYVIYTQSITEYFSRARGLAIGIVCSSTTICMIVTSTLVQTVLREGESWRSAWIYFSAMAAITWPLIYFGFKDTSLRTEQRTTGRRSKPWRELASNPSFYSMGAIFFAISLAATGPMLQIVPIAASKGLSSSAAVIAASCLAIGVGLSRVAAGLLLDHLFAPHLLLSVIAAGVIGCLTILLAPVSGIYLGCFLLGTAVGAEGDVLAYLVGKYFPLENYTQAYSLLYSGLLASVILSPILFGLSFDLFGNYEMALGISVACFAVAGSLIPRLPRYVHSK